MPAMPCHGTPCLQVPQPNVHPHATLEENIQMHKLWEAMHKTSDKKERAKIKEEYSALRERMREEAKHRIYSDVRRCARGRCSRTTPTRTDTTRTHVLTHSRPPHLAERVCSLAVFSCSLARSLARTQNQTRGTDGTERANGAERKVARFGE
jgi:hypothetical protein